MARRRYYRRYTRVVAPRKKWATNMSEGSLTSTGGTQPFWLYGTLAKNNPGGVTPTPVILKTGNFKIQGDCYIQTTGTAITNSLVVTLYVLYVPEVAQTANYITMITDHPEWIMAWKVLDINFGTNITNTNTTAFTFSSRLKRNLNSGDSVQIVAVLKEGNTTTNYNLRVNYLAQFWTCAN